MAAADGTVRRYQFGKNERIRARQDITRVFDSGKRWSVKGMGLHVLQTGTGPTRAVFVTVRKYGNAVVRNRARRVVAECWRLAKHALRPGYDAVFVIYPGEDSAAVRCPQVQTLVTRSGLLACGPGNTGSV